MSLIAWLRKRAVVPAGETEWVAGHFVSGRPPQWIAESLEGWHRRADLTTRVDVDGEFRRGGGGYVSDVLPTWVVKTGRTERRGDGAVAEVWELYW